jgi:hypothetical protein
MQLPKRSKIGLDVNIVGMHYFLVYKVVVVVVVRKSWDITEPGRRTRLRE